MGRRLIRAYRETLEDFYIELRNTKWYQFKRRNELNEQIKKYKNLLMMQYMTNDKKNDSKDE
jgi:hypothetical protein